jgi:2-isopropylmalate synthase
MPEKVYIFDTTLRDGEQCPGASLEEPEKLEVAQQLARLNVDIIEAGFPIASPGDFKAVQKIARQVKGPIIAGLARALVPDIDAAYEAVKPSPRARIHVFLATSKIHMQYKLHKAEEEVLRQAVESVKYAKGKVSDVEFSPEDAARSNRDFLCRVVEAVIEAGATTVNIPDTVGYAFPYEFGELIRTIRERVPNIHKAIISVHCHDDLGLSVANSLSAVVNGARQVECTINGIGERAGNASMEEIVMAIRTRKDVFKDLYTDVNAKEFCKTSRLVSTLTGFVVPPNKAIVGQNAFSHESGIHQDGVLKHVRTYEIMRPEDVGFGESRLVLGKHSGRHAFSVRLKQLGMELSKEEIDRAFERFKKTADKKKQVYDEDLFALVEDELVSIPEIFLLEEVKVETGSEITPVAVVKVKARGKVVEAKANGSGPVDACCKAIDKVTQLHGELVDYSLHGVTGGKDAMGEVTMRVKAKGKMVTGRGASTDVIVASAKAYINAVNKAIHQQARQGAALAHP